MKKLLLLSLLILPITIFSQSINPDFQDGKIWFQVKPETRIVQSLDQTDPLKLPLTTIPGFEGFVRKYNVTNLSRPFFAAKTSDELQRTYLVEFTNYALVDEFVKELGRMSGVNYAEKVPLDKKCLTPNDPSFGSQWGLSIIGAPTAWNYFSTGSNIVIAIVDDAVERTHGDLSPNLWVNPGDPVGGGDQDGNGYVDDINGWDVGSNDNNPNPPSSSYDHGTHVAGISSARSNNSTGVASIGFSCKLMCVKATTTPTAITNGYDGIVYAAANGADVINMSWGGPGFSTTAQNICNYAWGEGCILVAAAGNDNVSSQFYPAAYNNVISVAATTSSDQKASFSNYGTWIDISAPGNNIYSTTVGNTYGNKSGTSMASPMVAGLVGLMWSLNPGMSKTDLINCLLTTADDISAMNPGYPGELGSGRIDAAAAMACVATTLSNPPVADFVANYTTITAGGSVNFTDLSTYTPTTWNWSFPGGTPTSFSGQNPPPITYAAAGTYNVTLTVSNANGTDTQTNTSYINVDPAGGCFAINLPIPGGWTLSNYFTGASPGADGWINGMNVYLDKQKAMYFDASALPYTQMVQCYFAFGLAYSATPSKTVPVRVYDGTGGVVGAQIGTTNLTMGQIMADVNGGFYTVAEFASPITLPASKRFFVAADLTNLQWTAGVKDTLSIVSNQNGQTSPSAIWEQQSDNLWYQYTTAGSWNLSASLLIHPFLTNEPVVATFTPGPTTICQGDQITFDAAGSTYQDTLLWDLPGSTPPGYVSEDPNPTVTFNTPGTHTVTLYVVGGGCSQLDSAQVVITVNPTPVVDVSAVTNPICNGGSTVVNASGAVTYLWSPSLGLSGTTGASVTANPTITTTYNIAGTGASGCVGNTSIEIEVLDPPVAMFILADDTIDCNTAVTTDGSGSTHASTFAWTYTGGSPGTSNASGDNITYNAAGDFAIQMIVTNSCGSDTATSSIHVLNNCGAGIEDIENGITGYYSYSLQGFIIESVNGFTDDMKVSMYNELGQLIYARNANENTNQLIIPVQDMRAGMYIINLSNNSVHKSFKFIVK